jgi:hypothetical protein
MLKDTSKVKYSWPSSVTFQLKCVLLLRDQVFIIL